MGFINVFVDDEREPADIKSLICRDYQTAYLLLLSHIELAMERNPMIQEMSLDNDMGNIDGTLNMTGKEFLKKVLDLILKNKKYRFYLPEFKVHSRNVIEADEMKRLISDIERVSSIIA